MNSEEANWPVVSLADYSELDMLVIVNDQTQQQSIPCGPLYCTVHRPPRRDCSDKRALLPKASLSGLLLDVLRAVQRERSMNAIVKSYYYTLLHCRIPRYADSRLSSWHACPLAGHCTQTDWRRSTFLAFLGTRVKDRQCETIFLLSTLYN